MAYATVTHHSQRNSMLSMVTEVPSLTSTTHDEPVISFTNIRKSFLRVNPWKACGPDGASHCVLRISSDQLAGVSIDIFNLSQRRSEVPTCFERTSIKPVAKRSKVTCPPQ